MTRSDDRPLRVMHYLRDVALAGGGVQRAVIDWCGALPDGETRVELVVTDAVDLPPEWVPGSQATADRPGVSVVGRVRRDWPMATLRPFDDAQIEHLRNIAGRCDVVHLHGVWMPDNLAVARIARQAGKPFVVSAHGMLNDWSMRQGSLKKRLFLKTIGKELVRNAAAWHCTAEGEANQTEPRLRGAGFDGPVHVLPLGVDTSGFANGVDPTPARQAFLKDHPANRPVLLFLSRIHQKKGLNELIEAVGLLGDAGKPATLVVAGQDDGEYARQAKQLAKQLGLDGGPRGDVRFVASVGGTLKWSLYAAADLFTLATRQENFGLVLIEAMGCGTPIVTTKGTDIWPVLEANGGHIVGMSPQAFAEGIMNALADADDLRRRATQGRQYVLEHLDARLIMKQYRTLYQQIASS